jgi:4-amino-4-deoxy-L-arabinose transferase-like glycosyltransferase
VRVDPRAVPPMSYARAVALVSLAGLAARGLVLGLTPLWSDEAFMGVMGRRGLGAMIDVVHNDNHPPLQYLLTRLSTAVSDSPQGLRLPSVLAGAAAVPLAAALGRRAGGDAGGVLAGAIVALTPLLVMWSRDARMYSLAFTMVLAMSVALWRALERPGAARLAIYFGVVLAGLYTHYLVILALPAQLLAALLFLRPGRSALIRATGVAIAAGAGLVPWLVYASPQFRHAGEPYWNQPFSIPGVVAELARQASHPGPQALFSLGALVLVPAAVAAVALAFRAARQSGRRAISFQLGAGALALLALFLVSLKKPLLDQRFTNMYTIEFLPVLGVALAWARNRWLASALLLGLAAVTVVQVVSLDTPDVPQAIAPLAGRVDPARDAVALNGPYRYYQVLYYADARTREATRVVAERVPWYEGLAGYRPGDILASVPDPPRTLYLVTDPGQADPPMPADLHRAARRCAPGSCLETWTH